MDKLAYSIPEVANLIDLAPSTVWELVNTGKLPSVRVSPRRVVIRAEALADYLKSQETQAVQE